MVAKARLQQERRPKRAGFTLIEMLIVMSLIGLLLSIALPRYFASLERSKEVTLRQNLQVLRTTIDKFYQDRGRYPETLEELVAAKYLRSVPVDPVTETAQWNIVPSENAEQPGIADVRSLASGDSSEGVPYADF